jgi:hypothetical protein
MSKQKVLNRGPSSAGQENQSLPDPQVKPVKS